MFYHTVKHSRNGRNNSGHIYGFPVRFGAWCNSRLKVEVQNEFRRTVLQPLQERGKGRKDSRIPDEKGQLVQRSKKATDTGFYKSLESEVVQYIGIAADETERVERHKSKEGVVMPLVEIGWTEADCYKWCEEQGILAPTYTSSFRDGCWFCHNQGVAQLRNLRTNYPDLWALLMKWDSDSPVTFHADGRTVHDFDKRFAMEDSGLINKDDVFRWEYLNTPPDMQLDMFGGQHIWK